MLMERREVIEMRQHAARQWLEAFAEKCRNAKDQPQGKPDRALMVIVLTNKTSDFLAEHDPQSLKQAQEALTGSSWEDHLPKIDPKVYASVKLTCDKLDDWEISAVWNLMVADWPLPANHPYFKKFKPLFTESGNMAHPDVKKLIGQMLSVRI